MTKTVRLVALIMALLMGASAIGMIAMYVSAAEAYDGTSVSASLAGAGTEADPYLIANGADLAYFAANSVDGAYYKLTNDIVWSSYVDGAEIPANNWTPIVFNGHFDGNGKTVSGLVFVDATINGVGFFAWAQGSVKNLTVKDSYFKGATKVAGIVGQIQDFSDEDKAAGIVRTLTVENCVNYATIVATEKNGYSGGILGGANRDNQIDLTISGCVNYGKVIFDNASANALIGGITGQINGRAILVENCANYGDVVCSTPVTGGICAQVGGSSNKADDGTYVRIVNCINYAAVSASRITGGITGRLYANATIENCVNVGTVTANVSGKNATQYGEIIGTDAGGKVVNTLYSEGCATNIGEPETAGVLVGTAKAIADINSDASAAELGEAYTIVDGVLTLKNVATAGQVESADPVVPDDTTEPAPADTTEPAPADTTEPAPVDTETAPADTTEPSEGPTTGDASVLYLVVALFAIAATVVVSKKREN